jgi:hypothetical protein
MLLAAVPLLVVAWFGRLKPVIAIGLMMISMLAMQIVAVVMPEDPPSLRKLIYTVQSPTNLSYFADADRSMDISTRDLLADFPHFMPQFQMHSQEKPPGPIVFFRAILGIFGAEDGNRTALIAGLIVGALATLSIPLTHLLIRTLTDNSTAAVWGACFIALAPGLVLHLPQMDQLYPVFTCALIICWYNALKQNSFRWAIAFGLTLAISCFVVYHFLVLGAFLVALTVLHIVAAPRKWAGPSAKLIVAAFASMVGFYVVLYSFTGFNPVATFVQALQMQAEHLQHLYRPYPKTIFDDLADFALGAGWLGVILALFAITRKPTRTLVLLCLGQLVLVAITGLMQTETARTWCFLLPLLAIPVGLELSNWSRVPRFAAIAMMWLILCLVGQNMKFIFKPMEQPTFTPPVRSAL